MLWSAIPRFSCSVVVCKSVDELRRYKKNESNIKKGSTSLGECKYISISFAPDKADAVSILTSHKHVFLCIAFRDMTLEHIS